MAPEEEADVTGRFGAGVHATAGQQGLDLRSDTKGFPVVRVVERFDAEGVASQEQALLALVPKGKGIHAAELVDHFPALALEEVQEDFGVAGGLEAAAMPFELGAELAVIVNLAVED